MRFSDVWPAKLLRMHSICSRSRFEGTLDSGENPFFLSFSGFNELTSNFHRIYPAGLSNLRSDVGEFTFRKDNFFITRFLFLFSDFRNSSKNISNSWWKITTNLSKFSSNVSLHRLRVNFRNKSSGFFYIPTFLHFQQQLSDLLWKLFSSFIKTAVSSLEE